MEQIVNFTIDVYRDKDLALLQKVPTPITPVKLNKRGQISLAYFDQKSTVDYIGVSQGIPICFDAKDCTKDTFPLANIHEHQMTFMREFQKQGGVSFLLIRFAHRNAYYYMRYEEIESFWQRMQDGGRKSFRFDELHPDYFLPVESCGYVEFLKGVEKHLEFQENHKNSTKST